MQHISMKSRCLPLLLLSLLLAGPLSTSASACIAGFGYTGTQADPATIVQEVGPSTAYLGADTTNSMVTEVKARAADMGPVIINLKPLIFNPNFVSVPDCSHYERGTSNPPNKRAYALLNNWKSNLDTWFSNNKALFEWGSEGRLVYALIVHEEANNYCVERWKLDVTANYVKYKLGIAEYGPIYLTASYGLRNTYDPDDPNAAGIVAKGLPYDPSSNTIDAFPSAVDLIGYSAYDIFDPSNDGHPLNLNRETWSTISGKLDQAMYSEQKTAVVVNAFCDSDDILEREWDIDCPPNWRNWWKLGVTAKSWADYSYTDSRNLFMVAFHWPDVTNSNGNLVFAGTESLHTIWDDHATITPNCTAPTVLSTALDFRSYTITGYGGGFQAGNPTVDVSTDGSTLTITNNGWRKINFPYTVTSNTVLEFDFRSTSQGEVQGVGFDVDNALSSDRHFKVYGTQSWGIQNWDVPGPEAYDTFAPEWRHYKIRVGNHFTGSQAYLTFSNDCDSPCSGSVSTFANVRVYEDN